MIDAHAHLTDPRLASDVDAVVARAETAGVRRILTCGEDVGSSEEAISLARRHPVLRAAVGIHPHRARTCDERSLSRLRALAADARVVAIGEIGIDLSGRSAPIEAQRAAFLGQLRLARELGMPVCVHSRDAGGLVFELIDAVPEVRGYVHCYSGGPEGVDEWRARGFAVSFAGTVTFPRNEALRSAAAAAPSDGILVETDSPYLAPQAVRGGRNEPALVVHTYEAIARERGASVSDLARAVGENASSLFGERW